MFCKECCNFMGEEEFEQLDAVCDACFSAEEPSIDDSVRFCPNCERPNQFGELCVSCQRDEQESIDAGERWGGTQMERVTE